MKKIYQKNRKFVSLRIYLFILIGICPLSLNSANDVAQQQIVVKGIVKDTKGEALIGVSISVLGSTTGTVTDIDGQFSIAVPSEKTELRFSYLGFQSQTIRIGAQKNITLTLSEDINQIEEVVVVGYGKQKKETLVGSVASISTKDLLQSPQANISNALIGRLPGLLSVQRTGEPGKDKSTLRIRGVGSFAKKESDWESDPQDPLIMVDGIEVSNYNDIDPSEIESLTILKDASATAVYGVRGANGVLLITTRRGVVGKPRMSLSTNLAATNFPFLKKNMNAYEYATSYNQAQAYDSFVSGNYNPKYTEEQLNLYKTHADPLFYPDIDWYDYMLKDYSYQTQTNFNISGGTEKVRYFVSLGYFTQEGMLNLNVYDPGYDYQMRYKRYNLRSNFDVNVTKNLLASFDISTQIGDLRNPNWSTSLLMEQLSNTLPFASPGVIDDKIILIPTMGGVEPPPIAYNKGWNHNYENNLNGSIRLNYKMDYLLQGLSLRGVVSYKNYNNDKKLYKQNGVTYTARKTDNDVLYLPNPDKPEPKRKKICIFAAWN
jgi:TonB-linked SusC/RagA family outer membrane protein